MTAQMKARLTALAALAIFTASLDVNAQAPSTLSAYGVFDLTTLYLNKRPTASQPGKHLSAVGSDTSRLGLTGSETLPDGWRAYFRLETGMQMDTGTQTMAAKFWNRQSHVALGQTQWGALQLGGQYLPALFISLQVDPFARYGLGGQYTLMQGLRGYQIRSDNALQYVSPEVNGVSGRLMARPGEGANNGAGQSASLTYSGGPLYAAALYDQTGTSAASVGLPGAAMVRSQTLSLAGTYQFTVLKLSAWYQVNRIDHLSNVACNFVGAAVPWGVGELRASWAHRNATGAHASLAAVGYIHPLSKRTQVYANIAQLNNAGSAAFGMAPLIVDPAALGPVSAGQDTRGAQVGVRHSF